ncbi:MAG TPA: multicopper oxidase domain-containing protein [Gammaproteobacteria bacterium]
MNSRIDKSAWLTTVVVAVLLLLGGTGAHAAIDGLTGPTFNLTASASYIDTPDGARVLMWGYGPVGGVMQYPGPTLIVNQGDTVTINLTNQLPLPVSMVFPGQEGVVATGGTTGLLTQESNAPTAVTPGDMVTYTFVANHPGTYTYSSGTRPDLQVEMGLVGAIIVRPNGAPKQAYNSAATAFDHEYLFLLTEIDPALHVLAEQATAGVITFDAIDTTRAKPVLWFINGRNGPDTLAAANIAWMPNQPYNCLPRIHPGEKLLLRLVGGGREMHPFHTHGNNTMQIARDGRLLESAPGAGPDLAVDDYTTTVMPGATYDALFSWNGAGLGWDIYGHAASDPLQPGEYAPDHGKPLPVTLPETQDLTFGGFYSGSPFLGAFGVLPPGEGGLNANGGLFYMWHSHTERELVNFDIFPGGMMTMLIIEPPGVPIE